ncbi:hypothetical protein [Rhodovarius crocodyli]|uniref:hypothetical protein n=1 Tax=Rhodovarius crocodyli TaxID=1979269 RepID=UPI0013E29369|nr:hypothetical protein [Rhodovarius crocodyli]
MPGQDKDGVAGARATETSLRRFVGKSLHRNRMLRREITSRNFFRSDRGKNSKNCFAA